MLNTDGKVKIQTLRFMCLECFYLLKFSIRSPPPKRKTADDG